MSAGVSDQRMKGQGNQVTNAPKEQQLESGGDELAEVSWRHQQQPSYAPPISSAADPYSAAGYYGTTALPYQAFGVGDGTWSTNGTDPMTFLGGYNPHDSYGMDGVFGHSTTPFSTAAFGQPASTFNYFHGNGDYSTWGQLGRAKQYDDYYRTEGLYVPDGIKAVETGVQALALGEHKAEKDRVPELKDVSGGSQPKKMTWASIASQPAKPAPSSQSGGLKKKGPGMPPPPIVPGKHNMDISAWDAGKSAPVVTAPPPPPLQPPPVPAQLPMPAPAPAPGVAPLQRGPPPQHQPPPSWAHAPRAPPPHQPHPQHQPHPPRPPMPAPPVAAPPPVVQPAGPTPHPVLDELRVKNDYNPKEFDLSAPLARFFVIKSYSEDDIHRSIKYEIWCSTEHGNKRLDAAFREREREGGIVYLFFSVNGSGHFCGMARMTSAVDYNSNSSVWSQDKWKGQFRVRWIYVKDVPNVQLRHIKLENNENKPVTNSRDTQEVPHAKGLQVLRPTRPLLVTTLSNTKVDDRLPKVEELLEKVDQEMMEVQVAKQPLKSILNNPLPKSPPQSILKKPKNRSYQECKLNEGRRRQRAASESDNLYCNFHIGSPIPGYDNRLSYLSNNMKRAKDNSGTGYSYGSAIASLGNPPVKSTSKYSKGQLCSCKEQGIMPSSPAEVQNVHILRTTAINDTVLDSPVVEMPRQDTPTPTCPAVSPALPVSSVTAISVPKKGKSVKKKVKSKVKVSKMKSNSKTECTVVDGEADDAHSRSPSPDPLTDSLLMETDAAADLMDRLEGLKPMPPRKEEEPISRLSTKLNGTLVSPKKVSSKERLNKDQMFIAALHTTNPFKTLPTRKESPLNIPELIGSCLRPSLFPRVPPYLKFIGHEDSTPLKIPVPIQKHLKWKLTTITPIVVKKTLTNSGFRLVKSECDTAECPQEETVEWIGIWGKHMKSLMFRAIKDGQKMNHFPGTFQIGRKDRLWRNLQKLAGKYGVSEFGIMPKTYVLPHDLKLLKHDWEKYAANNEKWIIKPPASARGTGIKVVSRWTQIPKKRPVVVQRYVSKPYLINGNKFDMRLYVLVTSVHPLRIYLYKDGLARFASVKYNDELTSLNDRYMHLTNYSINRLSKNYTPNEDFAACEGHKWTLQTLFHYLKTEKDVDTDALWDSMKDLVIKTIISGEASISSLTKANVTSRYNCYELFGIDVLLDEDLKPWLLEVNISPSLHSASPLDIHVKGPLVSTVLNIAQFQVPVKTNLEMLSKEKPHKLAGLPYDCRLYTVYLSKEERDKHIIYTNMEERDMYLRDILSTLTPDDVRHLIQAEDELTQSGDMERVFPTRHTHKYLGYLAGPRYYNRLFDAWEARYADNRDPGLELLRNLCDIGYHLEVPPVPLKRAAPQLSALDRCRMMWTRRRRPPRSGPQCPPSHRWSASVVRRPRPSPLSSPRRRPASAATPCRGPRPRPCSSRARSRASAAAASAPPPPPPPPPGVAPTRADAPAGPASTSSSKLTSDANLPPQIASEL